MSDDFPPLKLGADAVQALLPHRRPFLFVDRVEAIRRGARPALRAAKLVSANEPVFEGHFPGAGGWPGLSLWPGVHTIEGLGQTANVLLVIAGIAEAFAGLGRTEDDALAALRALDGSLRPGARGPDPRAEELVGLLGAPRTRMGFAGAYDIKLLEPVYAGSVIRYEVTLSHALANARRFEVEARVDDRPVARGSMTSALP